jgi:hypothetical protein
MGLEQQASGRLIVTPEDKAIAETLRARRNAGDLDASRLEGAARIGYWPAVLGFGEGYMPLLEEEEMDGVRGRFGWPLMQVDPEEVLEWSLLHARRFEAEFGDHTSPLVALCKELIRTSGEVLAGEQSSAEAREVLGRTIEVWRGKMRQPFRHNALVRTAVPVGSIAGLLQEAQEPGSDPACVEFDYGYYSFLADLPAEGAKHRAKVIGRLAGEGELSSRPCVWRFRPGPRRQAEFAAQRDDLIALLLRGKAATDPVRAGDPG